MKQLAVKPVPSLKRMLMVVAMTACMVSHAFAAPVPKAESAVTNDRITLGDVFDGVTSNADYYLAPAPAAGKTKTLNTADLMRISDAFNLGWKPENRMQQVVIRRTSNNIDFYDIQTALQDKLSERLKGQKFEMSLSDRSVSLRVPDSKNKAVVVQNLSYNPAKGIFTATVSAAAAPETKTEVSGRLYEISQLPVLKDPLRPGDVISLGDIDYIDMRTLDITNNMVVDAEKLVGLTPRRGIPAMKPVMAGDVQPPVIIKKGEMVTMTLRNNIVSLTTQGRALEDGSEGDVIRVMNITSKQVVGATVTGPQAVSIRPATGSM